MTAESLPDCYWDGPRPCSHDRGAPLPKPKPLSAWMSTHVCPQDDGTVGWNGAILTVPLSNERAAVYRRARDPEEPAASRGVTRRQREVAAAVAEHGSFGAAARALGIAAATVSVVMKRYRAASSGSPQ